MAVISDETSIEINKTQEPLKLLPVLRLGPFKNRSHLLGIHLHLPLSDDVTEEHDCGGAKLTFLSFDKQMVLKQALKDLADMLDVLCLILRED